MAPVSPLYLVVSILLVVAACARVTHIGINLNCPPGTLNDGNLCVPCPPNSISKTTNSFQCSRCLFDSFPNAQRTKCVICRPGSFVSADSRCLKCPANAYTTSLNAPTCKACPRGTAVRYPSGRPQCVGCHSGQFLHVESKHTVCRACFVGSFNTNRNTLSCNTCPPGTSTPSYSFVAKRSFTRCAACPAGTFSKFEPSTSLFDPAGAPDGIRLCTRCPFGMFNSENAMSVCRKCPNGSVSLPDRTGCTSVSTTVPSCAAGQQPVIGYNAFGGCTTCPRGTVSTGSTVTECAACPSYLKPSADRDECVCRKGYVKTGVDVDGHVICLACHKGMRPIAGNVCDCGQGKYFDWEKAKCQCRPGKTEVAGNRCGKCEGSQLSTPVGRGCAVCKLNFYHDREQDICTKCPYGTWSPANNLLRKCRSCSQSLQDGNGVMKCSCAPGQRSANGVCTACALGTVGFVNKQGCSPCFGDLYNDELGATTCKVCEDNRPIRLAKGPNASCLPPCPRNARGRADRCVCEAPFVNVGTVIKVKCELCPGGRVGNGGMGLGTCSCPPGTFQNGVKCTACPQGSFSNSVNAAGCKACAANRIAAKMGSTSCATCDAGSYSIFSGGSRCVRCVKGTFVTADGRCGKCKRGERVERGQCVECERGVSEGGTSSFCIVCDKGVAPNKSRSKCV